MNFFEQILHFLEGTMERPGNYGWFHLLAMGIVAAVCIFICIKFKNADKKTVNRIVFIAWLIMAVLEIYKQTIYTFNYSDGIVTWDYQWYAFPFQLCSTPLYVFPFVFLIKNEKIRDYFVAFSCFFSLFGGLAVLFYPNDVFVETIGINIQTMIHHGLQVIIGIFLITVSRKKLNIKFYLKALVTFAVVSVIAIGLNELVPLITDETFNMFYISSHFPSTLPVLSILYPLMPYPAFLVMYLIGFAVIGIIIYSVSYLIAGRKYAKK